MHGKTWFEIIERIIFSSSLTYTVKSKPFKFLLMFGYYDTP